MFEEERIIAIVQKNSITGVSNWTIRKSENTQRIILDI